MKCRLSISKETQNIMTFLREIACAPYMFQPLNHPRIQKKYDDSNSHMYGHLFITHDLLLFSR